LQPGKNRTLRKKTVMADQNRSMMMVVRTFVSGALCHLESGGVSGVTAACPLPTIGILPKAFSTLNA
jgi:hypothetical protein